MASGLQLQECSGSPKYPHGHPCVAFLPCRPEGTGPSRGPIRATFAPSATTSASVGLLQREVAERLGVAEAMVTNWELSRTNPALRFLPGILNFLGGVPRAPGHHSASGSSPAAEHVACPRRGSPV